MKKIISAILLLALLISSLTCFASPRNENDIAALLSELDIMKGDPDGNLRLDDNVSRSEFTKVAIAASIYRDSVATNLTISPFKDVLYTHWAAPYIKLAVSNNICKGYPNATFNPDGTVLYEEAVTMLLKVLGYTDNDFGISWPYGQIGIAQKINLCDDIDKKIGDNLNRRDVMIMLYNLLNTNPKGKTIDYIQTMDYKIAEDTILIATAKEDSSVGSDKVYTSTGLYKIDARFNLDNIGKKGDAVIKNNDELVSFIPSEQTINEYNIYQVLDDDVIVLDNGQLKSIDADKSLAIYNKTAKTTLQNMLFAIKPGDILTTYKSQSGALDYGILKTDELQGPYTVVTSNWVDNIGLSSANLTIMRNGVKAAQSEILVNDIIYYSKTLGIVWGYSNKITGIYEKALPNKDMPTKVVISGVTYSLEGVQAFNKLSSSGSFNYGDTVTLLLGKTNQIADVILPNNTTSEVYGYIFETGTKEFTKSDNSKYTNNYIKLALPEGGAYEYIADRNYETSKNSVVKLSFSGGVAKAYTEQKQSSVYGDFNWSGKKLGSNNLSLDIKILDVTSLDKNDAGSFTTVFPQRLDGVSLNANSILFADKNEKNEITTLILYDVTGDAYAYGIVTEADKASAGMYSKGSYTYDIGGATKTFVSTTLFSVYSGLPAKFTLTNQGAISNMRTIEKIDSSITNITANSLISGGNKFIISDKAFVYKKTSESKYMIMPISDIIGNSNYNLTAYYDKPTSSGGRVRIIIATEK